MGIRMALGAPARALRSMIVRDGVRLAAIGIGVGFVTALAATRSLQSLLFGVRQHLCRQVDRQTIPRKMPDRAEG